MRELALVLACALLPLAHARAQGGPASSRGTYATYVGGRKFAAESYTLTTQSDGTRRAEAEVTPPAGAAQKIITVSARTASPADYSQPRNIPWYVIDDIAARIKQH